MKKKYLALLTAMVIAVAGVGSSLEVAAADFTSEKKKLFQMYRKTVQMQ